MNLEYLQSTHTFHIERIMDFLSNNLPLCAIHQSRTILFFCYLFAILLEFLLYPPYSIGNTPFDSSTLFLPLIVVVVLHLVLTVCYVFGALFERASCATSLGLLFLLHAPFPIVLAIGGIILLIQSPNSYGFALSVIATIAFSLDFICGCLSRPSQRIILSFELVAGVPSGILAALFFDGQIAKAWIPFLPPFIYFGLYFVVLLTLSPCCNTIRPHMLTFLADPEIQAEFAASVDPQLKPFKSRADWADEPDRFGTDQAQRREPRNRWSQPNEGQSATRFPSRADFQLYNVETAPDNPLYLASPLPILALAIVLSVGLIEIISPLADFYFWGAGALGIFVIAVLLNSRATACSFLAFTNLDDKCLDVLWDHPSLSIL
jgi:hypothetical protein